MIVPTHRQFMFPLPGEGYDKPVFGSKDLNYVLVLLLFWLSSRSPSSYSCCRLGSLTHIFEWTINLIFFQKCVASRLKSKPKPGAFFEYLSYILQLYYLNMLIIRRALHSKKHLEKSHCSNVYQINRLIHVIFWNSSNLIFLSSVKENFLYSYSYGKSVKKSF